MITCTIHNDLFNIMYNMSIWIFLLVFILIAMAMSFLIGGFYGAPWVPSKTKDVSRVMHFSFFTSGSLLCDLGCGNGKLLFALAKKGVRGVGYEISVLPFLLGWIRSWWYPEVQIRLQSFWKADVSQVDVAYLFLSGRMHRELAVKLGQEMKKGGHVCAYVWPVPGLKLVRTDRPAGQLPIYIYRIT